MQSFVFMRTRHARRMFHVLVSFTLGLIFLLFLRIWWVLSRRQTHFPRQSQVKAVIVMGSGGHTSEMLQLISQLSGLYEPRVYIMADTDNVSATKIASLEKKHLAGSKHKMTYEIIKVPRSREVKQSYATSVLTTLYAALYCFPLIFKQRPDLLLCNGPGTCIPLCAAALVLKVLAVKDVTIVYVESICRVQTLSLSGKILYHLADHFLVQWKKLQNKYPKAIYLGRIV